MTSSRAPSPHSPNHLARRSQVDPEDQQEPPLIEDMQIEISHINTTELDAVDENLDDGLPPDILAWAAKKRRQSNLRSINKAIAFFKRIGLPFQVHPPYEIPEDTFFPGCWLDRGKLHFCKSVADVGQILHESGHLALLPRHLWSELRPGGLQFETPLTDFGVEAWDYCAAIAADIPILAVFAKNFDGGGFQIWEYLENGKHPGVMLLELAGMAEPFPKMKKWYATEKAIRMGNELIEALNPCGDADALTTFNVIHRLAESWKS